VVINAVIITSLIEKIEFEIKSGYMDMNIADKLADDLPNKSLDNKYIDIMPRIPNPIPKIE
jgi:hypothetical protein